MKNTFISKAKQYVPVPVMVLIALALICGILHAGFIISTDFADAFDGTVSMAVRFLMAHLTAWIPFSLAEAIVILAPFVGAFVIYVFVKNGDDSWKGVCRFVTSVMAVMLVIYILFVLMFAAGYRGSELKHKMGLDVEKLSADDIAGTLEYVIGELNSLSDKVDYDIRGASVMPYSLAELNGKLMDAYTAVSGDYPFVARLTSRFKPIVLSGIMTYTHISGVYSFFTGESNVNTNYPDYIVAFSAAHELAHQRGIARENEANFIAYLVCTASDDDFLRYSGYLNMYEYLSSAMLKASKEKYTAVAAKLGKKVRSDLRAYSEFFKKYEHSVASEVSGKVNDTYLKVQGTAGTASYGMVVDYAVAYHKDKGDAK